MWRTSGRAAAKSATKAFSGHLPGHLKLLSGQTGIGFGMNQFLGQWLASLTSCSLLLPHLVQYLHLGTLVLLSGLGSYGTTYRALSGETAGTVERSPLLIRLNKEALTFATTPGAVITARHHRTPVSLFS